MTAQAREILIYKGKRYGMATEPLEPYIETNNIQFNPESICSACWRGYIGTWSIEDGRLYLININIITDDNGKKVGLEYLFPNQKKVFADWFTGILRIPYGELIEYIHSGYDSLYEKELFLKISKGVLVNERKIDNTLDYDNQKETESRTVPTDRMPYSADIERKKIKDKISNKIRNFFRKLIVD